MSKKLIAVAAAAALALTGLVVMPTVATATPGPFNVLDTRAETKSIANTNGSTADLEHTILVPSQDVLRFDADSVGSTTGTLLRYKVKTPLAGAAISVTAAGGGARLITAAQQSVESTLTSASGTTSLSITSDTSGDATFYAYTTSTADSTITVSSGGASKILYMKGVTDKGNAYKLNFAASPLATAASGEITFTGTVTDMFGNTIGSLDTADLIVTGLGGDLTGAQNKASFAQSATTGVVTFEVVNRNTTGAAALSLTVHTSMGVGGVIPKVAAFGDPVSTQFFSVNAIDLSAQVTALTAQVAALTAQLAASRPKANSVTKKRYNTLVRAHRALGGTAKLKR